MYKYTNAYICIYLHIHTDVYLFICIYLYMFIFMYEYIWSRYTQACIYMYIYVYFYIYLLLDDTLDDLTRVCDVIHLLRHGGRHHNHAILIAKSTNSPTDKSHYNSRKSFARLLAISSDSWRLIREMSIELAHSTHCNVLLATNKAPAYPKN